MATQIVEDGSGRVKVVITETDPDIYVSNLVTVARQSSFVEAISVDVSKAKRGEVLVTGQVMGAGTEDYLGIDVRILGFVGSTRIVLARTFLGGEALEYRHEWCDGRTYDRIAVEGRQIVDGLPSTATVTALQVQAVGRFWT